jgi:GntR family transcriptional repressor for pyruvate dehydrogenase complex
MTPSETRSDGATAYASVAAPGNGRVEALSLAESASARVVELLHSGQFQPGQRLPSERKLAVELAVSRSVLREALRTLESTGLLEARAGSGWYVTGYGHADGYATAPLTNWMKLQPIGDIVAVRRVLEPEAIHAIPATRVRQTAAAARELFEEMRRAHRAGEFQRATDLHTKFHWTLVQYASTRLLRNLLASMIEAAGPAQLEVFRTPQAGTFSLGKHLWIVEAIESGDVEETARRVAEHLEPVFTYPAGRSV